MIEHADHALGAESFGTTADEQERGEPIDSRLAEERPSRPISDDEPGIIDEQNYGGKSYRVFFAKDPYGVCFCFTHPLGPKESA